MGMKTGKLEIQWNQRSYDGYLLTTMLFPWHKDGQTEGFGSKEELLKLIPKSFRITKAVFGNQRGKANELF